MSLSEKLIRAAKNGSSREVRKLLGRGVQITKDKVRTHSCSSILLYTARSASAFHDVRLVSESKPLQYVFNT